MITISFCNKDDSQIKGNIQSKIKGVDIRKDYMATRKKKRNDLKSTLWGILQLLAFSL